jgi:signal transduction histidine kinase
LRTPLTPIAGYVEMLLDGEFGPLTGEQREAIETVRAGAARLQTLTDALLDVTRIEAERVELVLRPTDLAELVQAVVAQYQPQIEAKAQRLTLDVPPDLPFALCDATRAAQVVGNLMSNASKYTPREGQIVLALGVADEEGFLKVSVADNGVGISPEDQPKLFGRFFRAKSAVQAEASGAGLGLYITRSLVELHGGRIWFESEPGRGSTFFVNFPVAT